MSIMKELMITWILSLGKVFIILGFVLIFAVSATDVEGQNVDSSASQLVEQLLEDVPDFVKQVLEEEGIDLEEVMGDPELLQEIREKVMDNPEIREEFQKRMVEEDRDEESPPEEPSDEEHPQKDLKLQIRGRQKVNKYYQSIVDKNLFRPLGWGGDDKRGPDFRIIGTVINKGQKPKALIFEFANKTTHYVAVGDKLGNATVKSIEEKSVTLEQDGEEEIKLKIVQESPFLGGSVGDRRGVGPQVGGGPTASKNNLGVNRSSGERPDSEMREKLRRMVQEGRKKFNQQMREERRRERGGDGNRGGAIRREILRRR
jgi:hypothetical protein